MTICLGKLSHQFHVGLVNFWGTSKIIKKMDLACHPVIIVFHLSKKIVQHKIDLPGSAFLAGS